MVPVTIVVVVIVMMMMVILMSLKMIRLETAHETIIVLGGPGG